MDSRATSAIFNNKDEADEKAYEAGEFKSVNFNDAIDRLADECAIDITAEQRRDLERFRRRRNKIEHFGAVDSLISVQASISKMVSFIIEFVETAFEPKDLEDEEGMIADIRSKLGACNAVVDHRWSEIKDEVAKQYSTVGCPSCQQNALSADAGTVRCLFCYYATDSETAVNDYVSNILGFRSRYAIEKDGDEWPVRLCPECGHHTFVTQIPGPYDTHDTYCFNCGQEFSGDEMEDCYDCGELYNCGEERGHHICSDCFRARVMKDD